MFDEFEKVLSSYNILASKLAYGWLGHAADERVVL
jgi:hypothetical protein